MRLEKAFEIAEKHINIPKLLDAGEVMKGTADERSLILYTSLFFHAFSAKAQKDAHEAEKQKLVNLENSLSSAHESREELLRQLGDLEKNRYSPPTSSPLLFFLPSSLSSISPPPNANKLNKQGLSDRLQHQEGRSDTRVDRGEHNAEAGGEGAEGQQECAGG